MQIKFASTLPKKFSVLCLLIGKSKALPKEVSFDKETTAMLKAALDNKRYNNGRFEAKKKEQLYLTTTTHPEYSGILLCGVGDTAKLTADDCERIGGQIFAALAGLKTTAAAIVPVATGKGKIAENEQVAHLAHGANLRSYAFNKYFTKDKPKLELETLTFICKDSAKVKTAFAPLEAEFAGVSFTRECVSEPPNVLYPESMAERCQALRAEGLGVEVLDEEDMQKLGMGSLLGVAQGSVREPRLIILTWNGSPKGKKDTPIAFIGKGVTFDTGGISIKPSAGMEDMKYDMAGSAVVGGLMRTLALRKAKVNAVGILGMVENMPDGNAQRPSDIVTSMSGQTIEVLNTDAEGRLVLADALWYCQQRFKPKFMIDLATLTGAIVVALGTSIAGLFSNNAKLEKQLLDAGKDVGEKLWPFPMDECYDKMIKSEVADMQNISNERGAGSITAAKFLDRFVNDIAWAHLDIAGVAWAKKACDLWGKGATGYGVRLLNRLVAKHYE